MHTLPLVDGRRRKERRRQLERDRREEERKECICGLLDRVGGRVRRLGRALRWREPRPREHTQTEQPGADLDRRNIRTNERTNGNSAYTYYRIYHREREKEGQRDTMRDRSRRASASAREIEMLLMPRRAIGDKQK